MGNQNVSHVVESGNKLPFKLDARYSLGKTIRRGKFAEVRQGFSKVGGTEVEVKIILKTNMKKLEEVALKREIDISRSLQGAVKVYEVFEEGGYIFVIMEHCFGGDLFDRVVKQTFYEEKDAKEVMKTLVSTILSLHEKNIIHRDLRPELLYLTSPDDITKVKLGGFALAVQLDSYSTPIKDPLPPSIYSSPEVLLKKPYGKPIDMWAVGVILFILLGGYPPFHDEDPKQEQQKILEADFVFHAEYWGNVSLEAKDLIKKLLNTSPEKRFTIQQTAAHPWLAMIMKTTGSSNTTTSTISTISALPHTIHAMYNIGDTIGSGGSATVRIGVNNIDNSTVAIKIVSRTGLDAEDERDFLNEVAILNVLKHPHIVQCVDFFEEPDNFYIVMEHIKGGELFDRFIQKVHYSEKEARDLVYSLLTAVKYIHDIDIIHRDLKPENLVMQSPDDDASVKIIDFGFATKAKGFNVQSLCGTRGYMAPEILGRKPYGKPVDMWSFGVILYILLGGYPPFYSDDDQKLNDMTMNGAFSFHEKYWAHVSQEAKNLIQGLLTVNPHKRFTVDETLRHPWLHQHEDMLRKSVLTANLDELRKFQGMRLKGAVKAVVAINKMKKMHGDANKAKLELPHTLEARYEVGDVLGEGGFSIVKLARSRVDGSTAAVKIVKRDGLPKEDEESLRDEVKILHRLSHPNVVRLYDFFEESHFFYVAMEHIQGGELFDRIVQKTTYNEKEARDLVYILLNAIKYLHDNNIVHRDLKPENLLLQSKDDDASVKLIDFGFAVEAPTATITSQCGTPGYMAPEILYKRPYGKSVDMWAFGVILYILLGGYPPFHDDNRTKLFKKICAGEYQFHPEYWNTVSDEAKDLIRGLLTISPAMRLTVDQALVHPWMNQRSDELAARNLDSNLVVLKKHRATAKLKAGVKAVMAINRFKKLGFFHSEGSQSSLPHTIEARYVFAETLGEGGFGIVKAATGVVDNKRVAIKIVKREGMEELDELALRDEADILMKLTHPNIVRAFDFFEEEKHFYVVMECLEGGELFDRIVKKTVYNEKEARDLVAIILGGIGYLHEIDLVHRDLKPENLLLTSRDDDSSVKIADFGFAIKANGFSIVGRCGTRGYMAPEILERKPYGKPVDMWAFGIILYILLGGYPPFHDENEARLQRKICTGTFAFHPEYWNSISAEAKDLISGLLTVNPHKRLTVQQALRHTWLQKLDAELSSYNLNMNLEGLRNFQANKKLKAGVKAIMAFNKLKGIFKKDKLKEMYKHKSDLPRNVHARYEMNETLGEGSFGLVKAAKSKFDGSIAAIKIIKRENMDVDELKNLRREVELLQKLDHPNIVKMLDFFEETQFFYVVMEKVDGGELFDRIVQKTSYNEKEARDLAYVILIGMKHLHDQNIVHRDLKPENLLLTSRDDDANVKIIDFGFAAYANGFTLTDRYGTPGYIAPEILKGHPYGKPVDMWSFGVILYILLAGYPPFHDEDEIVLSRRITAGVFAFHDEYWSGISQDAKDLIKSILCVDPIKRLTVDQVLVDPWMNRNNNDLETADLNTNLEALKKFQNNKKLKGAVKAVLAINKMKRFSSALRNLAKRDDSVVAAISELTIDSSISSNSQSIQTENNVKSVQTASTVKAELGRDDSK